MRVNDFVKFIKVRERYRRQHEERWGRLEPKKRDPILEEYRFCNVRRNDDRVTKWVFANVLEPFKDDPMLWFYLTIARIFNRPDTLEKFTPTQYRTWEAEVWRKKLHKLSAEGPIFNGAYIVSTNGRSMNKIDYVIDHILKPLWTSRSSITAAIKKASHLNAVHETLKEEQGLGSFMAAQIVADLKYANPARWSDFNTFAASGPGSKRGLNRVLGFAPSTAMREHDFRETLAVLRDATNARLTGMEPITAQDIQNCLCEFDKYERVRLGEGRPKQKYTPFKEK